MKKSFLKVAAVLAFAAFALAGCNKKAEAGAAKVSGKAAPESDFEVELIENDTAVRITKYNGSAKKVIIPGTIQGYPVHDVNIEVNDKCKVVSIPEGVVMISGLKGGSNLETVALPESLKFITDYAFTFSTSIYKDYNKECGPKSISFPSGLLVIGQGAFMHCRNLTDVDFSAATSLKLIGENAFYGSSIKKAALPDSLKYICEGAFKSCDNLSIETISLSDSPSKIILLSTRPEDMNLTDLVFDGAKLSEESKSSDLKIQKAFKDEFQSKLSSKLSLLYITCAGYYNDYGHWVTSKTNYPGWKKMLVDDIPGTTLKYNDRYANYLVNGDFFVTAIGAF